MSNENDLTIESDDLWDQAKQDSVGDAKKTMDYVKWIEEHYPQQVKGYTRQMIIEAFIAGQEVQKQVKPANLNSEVE